MALFSRDSVQTGFKSTPKSASFNHPRGITASAVVIDTKNKSDLELLRRRLESSKKWQRDAFDYTELIGEIHFAADMIANTVSKVRLFPGYITDQDTAPSNINSVDEKLVSSELRQAAFDILQLLSTGDGGVAGVLRDAALNLFVAGECFLVREPAPGDSFFEGDRWQIRSIDEIVIKDGPRNSKRVYLRGARDDSDADLTPLGNEAQLQFGRIWRNHPRYSKEADSSLKPQLENCDMVLLYDRAKRSIVKSRLNAGLLYLPDGIHAATEADGELEDPTDLEDGEMAPLAGTADTIEEDLMTAWVTAIQDESSASATVPVILRGPAALAESIKHITFTRTFDPQITTDAQRTLERILLGLDLPKEVVAGLTDAKYANAVVVEDNFYKSHIEPMLLNIVDAFTMILMRPMLRALGFSDEEVRRVCVWYDPSPVSTKPDKATAATTGYTLGILSADAWIRAHAFADSDKAEGLERIQRLAEKKGLLSEPVTEAALRSLYPALFDQLRQQQLEQTDAGTQDAVQEVLDGGTGVAPEPGAPTEEPAAPAGPTSPPVPLIEP